MRKHPVAMAILVILAALSVPAQVATPGTGRYPQAGTSAEGGAPSSQMPPSSRISPSSPAAPSSQIPTVAPSGRAILIQGPETLRGLPFFSPNAIPALGASYLLADKAIRVWYTREALWFSDEWHAIPEPSGPGIKQVLRRDDARLGVIVLRTQRFSLFLSLPDGTGTGAGIGPEFRRFSAGLVSRFAFFFDNAATDAELSFPATIDF